MATESFLERALPLIERGFRVLPLYEPDARHPSGCSCHKAGCTSVAKHPRCPNGVSEATDDELVVREWNQRWPRANVGVACGQGTVVIDIDPRHGGDETLYALEQEHGALPETWEVLTGGGGRHIYFRGAAKPYVGEGVEVRSDGQYVVGPGSLHASGNSYQWELGHHPEDVLFAEEVPTWVVRLSDDGRPPGQSYVTPKQIPAGKRHNTFVSMAGQLRRNGYEPDEILAILLATNERRCQPDPLPLEEITTIAKSTAKWEPGEITLRDDAPVQHVKLESPSEPVSALKVVNAKDPVVLVNLDTEEIVDDPVDWFEMLGEEGFTGRELTWLISSLPKCGKSTLLYHCSRSWALAGYRVIILSEEPAPIIRLRARRLNMTKIEKLAIYRGTGAPWNNVLRWLRDQRFDLLIIDTTRYWFRLPAERENDAATIMSVVTPIQDVTRNQQACLILSHHIRKGGGEEGRGHAGSTAWVGVADVASELLRIGNDRNRRVIKSESRFDTYHAELLLEMTGTDYRSLGDAEGVTMTEVKRRALECLSDATPITVDLLMGDLDPVPSKGTLSVALRDLLKEGLVEREGSGKKGNPYLWRRL